MPAQRSALGAQSPARRAAGLRRPPRPAMLAAPPHVVVARAPGRYGGWPANHGIWSWGDEILVGFSWGHMRSGGAERGHPIDRAAAGRAHARAQPGRRPDVEARKARGPRRRRRRPATSPACRPSKGGKAAVPLTAPIDFTAPGFALTARMSDINVGPSWFFYTTDKGRSWNGPFTLPDFGQKGIAARTDYLVDGPRELTMFLTAAKSNGREGRVICVADEGRRPHVEPGGHGGARARGERLRHHAVVRCGCRRRPFSRSCGTASGSSRTAPATTARPGPTSSAPCRIPGAATRRAS